MTREWTAEQREAARRKSREQWAARRAEAGVELGYFGAHRRVRAERGRAGDRSRSECGEPARHWAWIHDTDPNDVQNYLAMCQSCHFRYDEVAARGRESMGSERRREAAMKAWETKRRKAAE